MSTGSDSSNLAPVKAGDILAGKYEVERVLGFGGMGVVVAAKHVHLGERVAIKFLLPQALKKAEVVERFLREGRAAVRIKSEHVARVFDVGKLDDGAPYMVMEFLEGADLSTLLKTKGAVPIELAVEYVLQACEAIAEAHSLKIIHRDLKPANLFVAKRADGSPVVKVIDFGISKVADPTTGTDVEMTKTDVMMGSPVYMAPEQMISARDVDERADVWSLGVILFYLVMGAQPFRGNSVTQLYASIIEGPPRMRDTRPDVPPELEAAVQKMPGGEPEGPLVQRVGARERDRRVRAARRARVGGPRRAHARGDAHAAQHAAAAGRGVDHAAGRVVDRVAGERGRLHGAAHRRLVGPHEGAGDAQQVPHGGARDRRARAARGRGRGRLHARARRRGRGELGARSDERGAGRVQLAAHRRRDGHAFAVGRRGDAGDDRDRLRERAGHHVRAHRDRRHERTGDRPRREAAHRTAAAAHAAHRPHADQAEERSVRGFALTSRGKGVFPVLARIAAR